jgi:uncharacterized protein
MSKITPLLDKTSYKVFKFKDKMILYDLSTNTICRVNDELTYDILRFAGEYDMQALLMELNAHHSNIDEKSVNGVIEPMREVGFFISVPACQNTIEETKAKLLAYTPYTLALCIAQSCNLACIYCYAEDSGSNSKNQLMEFKIAKKSIDYLVENSKNIKTLHIQFFGGEPLLNFQVMKQAVEYTGEATKGTDKKFTFSLTTNATILNDEIQRFLIDNDITTKLSIDGDQVTHDKQRPFRNGGGSYRQVLINSLKFKDKLIRNGKLPPSVRANVINGSAEKLSKIAETFSGMGFRAIDIAAIFGKPGMNNDLAITEEEFDALNRQMDDYIEQWLDNKVRGERPLKNNYIEREVSKKLKMLNRNNLLEGIRCGVGRGTNAVDVDGNIYPCHRYQGMEKYIIGNITEGGVDSGKVSAYYSAITENMLENCTTCWMRYKCGGPCPWRVSIEDGGMCPSDKLSCDDIKYSFMQGAYLYVSLREAKPEVLKHYVEEEA